MLCRANIAVSDCNAESLAKLKSQFPSRPDDGGDSPAAAAQDIVFLAVSPPVIVDVVCAKIVDAVKAELKLPNLKVAYQPVTSANRIPLLQAGTIDMECGSTTNSVERQKQVAFGPTYFVINVTAAVKKASGIKPFADLNGKTIARRPAPRRSRC